LAKLTINNQEPRIKSQLKEPEARVENQESRIRRTILYIAVFHLGS